MLDLQVPKAITQILKNGGIDPSVLPMLAEEMESDFTPMTPDAILLTDLPESTDTCRVSVGLRIYLIGPMITPILFLGIKPIAELDTRAVLEEQYTFPETTITLDDREFVVPETQFRCVPEVEPVRVIAGGPVLNPPVLPARTGELADVEREMFDAAGQQSSGVPVPPKPGADLHDAGQSVRIRRGVGGR